MSDPCNGVRNRRTTALIALMCVGLLSLAPPVHAQQVKGSVINRDGVFQPGCKVNLVDLAGPTTYEVWTNAEGAFYLDNPRYGAYKVTVSRGEKGPSQIFEKVTVSEYGLSPSTLVVDW